MRKILPFVSVIILCLFVAQALRPDTPTFAQAGTAATGLKVLALVNQWRLDEGMWPLKQNTTLQAMAQNQANYLSTVIKSFDDSLDFHADAKGLHPQERAVLPPYNWPNYGAPGQVEIGENAGLGSPEYALNYWHKSAIHKKTALNRTYREAGVGVVPFKTGFIIIIVFGARPGVLPIQTDETRTRLFIPNEFSRYTKLPAGGMRMTIINANGVVLVPEKPWQSALNLPEGTSGVVRVRFTSGPVIVADPIDLSKDVAVLPRTLDFVTAVPAVPATATSAPTTAPQATATQAVTPTNTPGAPSATPTTPGTAVPATPVSAQPSATATAGQPSATPSAVPPSPTPSATPNKPADLVLIYDAAGLYVLNGSSGTLDISDLTIGSSIGNVTVQRWLAISSFPAAKFPAGSCLAVSIPGKTSPQPSQCKFVRSHLDQPAARAFWTQGQFTVSKSGKTVATCDASAKRCEVRF